MYNIINYYNVFTLYFVTFYFITFSDAIVQYKYKTYNNHQYDT